MIFIIGFAFIFLGLLANDGWPGMLLGGGLAQPSTEGGE